MKNQKALSWIRRGNIDRALKYIEKKYHSKGNKQKLKVLTPYMHNFYVNERNYRQGIVNYNDYMIMQNKLINGIINEFCT